MVLPRLESKKHMKPRFEFGLRRMQISKYREQD